jgi:predicted nucleotidyltransferase
MPVVSTPRVLRTEARDRRGRVIDVRPIAPVLARVVERWQPLQIWLFGSRARGDAASDSHSDWDLLALVPDCPEPADFDDPMTVWRVRRQPRVSADLVVYRASDFASDRAVPNTLAYAADLDGVLLYER